MKTIGNSIFRSEQEEGIDSPFGNWRKTGDNANDQSQNKSSGLIKLTYKDCKVSERFLKINFLIQTTNLNSKKQFKLRLFEYLSLYKTKNIYDKKIFIHSRKTDAVIELDASMTKKLNDKAVFAEVYSNELNNSISLPKLRCENIPLEVCPIDPNTRSHFVIHCTAGNMSTKSIKESTNYDSKKKKKRSRAHVYVNKDGTSLKIWPLSEKKVWATKAERKKDLIGRMFHIELNYGSPSKPTSEQYQTLADLYQEAASIEQCYPIIVPHIEVDRGLADGHQDPTDFDYNKFYGILKERKIPIDDLPKFDHDRYWGHKSYKVPWKSDKFKYPPVLEGNPHK